MIHRRLTLELLRLAVKEKVVGRYDLPWQVAHGEHLDRMVQDVEARHKQSGTPITTPPSERTFKDFLNQSPADILRLRSEAHSKKGMPFDPCTEYLVRILDLDLCNLVEFERLVTQLGLHPDTVVASRSSILDLLRQGHKMQARDALQEADEQLEDASMSQDPFLQQDHPTGTHSADFEIPADVDAEADGVAVGKPIPWSRRNKLIWISVAIAITISAAVVYFVVVHPFGAPDALQSSPVPQIDIHTSGDNSPIIHNTEGDVHYWGSIRNTPSDSFSDSTLQP